jgi:hypothetical protein
MTLAVTIEIFSIWLCHELVGGVAFWGGLIYFVSFPNLAALIFLRLRRKNLARFIFAFTAICVIGYHLSGYLKSQQIQNDVTILVDSINDSKRKNGHLPIELAQYSWMSNSLNGHIQNYEVNGNNFTLFYYLMTPSISHWYSSETGWGHDDD